MERVLFPRRERNEGSIGTKLVQQGSNDGFGSPYHPSHRAHARVDHEDTTVSHSK